MQTLSSHMSRSPLTGLKIVVVEDHNDTREYLGLFLGRLGAGVVLASNAFEGVEAIKNNRPDLGICDIQMPGADGFQLLRQTRALGPNAGGSVPLVAMTGLTTQADRARILNAGFQAYLSKPFTPNMLTQTILTVVSNVVSN
jgi:CheY-like chemotaxis protein